MRTLPVVVLLSAMSFGQATVHPGGGTDVVSPVYLNTPPGQSPTLEIVLTPASAQFPCKPAPAGQWALCGQPMPNGTKEVTVDYGTGTFLSLKGDQGDPGLAGENGRDGINGTNGINGINGKDGATGATGPTGPAGAAWSTVGKLFTIHCAWGGHGVPNFTVTGCTITQQ